MMMKNEESKTSAEAKQKRSEILLKMFNKEIQKNPTFVKLTFQMIDCDDFFFMYSMSPILNSNLNFGNDPLLKCKIMYLDLTGNRLGNSSCCALLAEILSQNDTIQYLNMSLNDMGADGLSELVKVLYNNKKSSSSDSPQAMNTSLKHLDLSANRIGEEGIRQLIDVVKNNNSLVTISVRSNKVKSSTGVDALLELMALSMSGEHAIREVFV